VEATRSVRRNASTRHDRGLQTAVKHQLQRSELDQGRRVRSVVPDIEHSRTRSAQSCRVCAEAPELANEHVSYCRRDVLISADARRPNQSGSGVQVGLLSAVVQDSVAVVNATCDKYIHDGVHGVSWK